MLIFHYIITEKIHTSVMQIDAPQRFHVPTSLGFSPRVCLVNMAMSLAYLVDWLIYEEKQDSVFIFRKHKPVFSIDLDFIVVVWFIFVMSSEG